MRKRCNSLSLMIGVILTSSLLLAPRTAYTSGLETVVFLRSSCPSQGREEMGPVAAWLIGAIAGAVFAFLFDEGTGWLDKTLKDATNRPNNTVKTTIPAKGYLYRTSDSDPLKPLLNVRCIVVVHGRFLKSGEERDATLFEAAWYLRGPAGLKFARKERLKSAPWFYAEMALKRSEEDENIFKIEPVLAALSRRLTDQFSQDRTYDFVVSGEILAQKEQIFPGIWFCTWSGLTERLLPPKGDKTDLPERKGSCRGEIRAIGHDEMRPTSQNLMLPIVAKSAIIQTGDAASLIQVYGNYLDEARPAASKSN